MAAVAAIIAAGAVAGAAAAAAANSDKLGKSKYYKANREELDELLARQKAGKLGLTGPEQVRLIQQQQVGMGANDVAAKGALNQAMQGSGAGFGASSIAATAAQMGNRVLADQGREAIAEADRAAAMRQRKEIEARRALQEQRRAQTTQAAAQVVSGGVEGAMQGWSLGRMAGSPPGGAPDATKRVGDSAGDPQPLAAIAMQRSMDSQRLKSAGVPAATAEQWAMTLTPEQMSVIQSMYS